MAAADQRDNDAIFKNDLLQHDDESSSQLSAPCSKKRNTGMAASGANAPTIYFFSANDRPFGCFSNWSDHGFTHTGIWFVSSEQAYMWEKAAKFDPFVCAGILKETKAWKIKELGRDYNIRNFDEKEWDALRYDVMFEILMAKFAQNPAILAILLGTGSAELAEASPYDKKWGIGFDAENAEANRGRWHRNLLGKALVAVRVRLGGEAAVPVPVPVGVPALAVAAAPAIARWRSPAKMCVHCKVQPRYRTYVQSRVGGEEGENLLFFLKCARCAIVQVAAARQPGRLLRTMSVALQRRRVLRLRKEYEIQGRVGYLASTEAFCSGFEFIFVFLNRVEIKTNANTKHDNAEKKLKFRLKKELMEVKI
jgi:ribA/ribD-fused uncharacterized protein